jgi:deoxyribodipyrimidine photo-lyase
VFLRKNEVIKDDGTPYTVFTPYSRKWKAKLNDFYLKPYPSRQYAVKLFRTAPLPMMSLAQIGFSPSDLRSPSTEVAADTIKKLSLQAGYSFHCWHFQA